MDGWMDGIDYAVLRNVFVDDKTIRYILLNI